MTNMKQKKLIKNTQIKQKHNLTQIFAEFYFILFRGMGFEYKENKEVGKIKYCSFFIPCSSSSGVSSFLPDVLVGLYFFVSL